MRPDLPAEAVELGFGHWYTWLVGDPATHPTDDQRLLRFQGQDETVVGIIEWHLKPDGELCGGAVLFVRGTGDDPQRPTWVVNALDPLDISPSVLCSPEKGGCGSHGFIREGRWISA